MGRGIVQKGMVKIQISYKEGKGEGPQGILHERVDVEVDIILRNDVAISYQRRPVPM